MAALNESISAVPIERLGDEVRARYRDLFAVSLAAGEKQLFVIPWSLLAAFIVPTLWLAVPRTAGTQTARSKWWLRRAHWAVVAFIIAWNSWVTLFMSSPNFATGYGTGLVASWGTMLSLNLLVWTSPQEEAARIVKRRRRRTGGGRRDKEAVVAPPNGSVDHGTARPEGRRQEPHANGHGNGNSLRHRKSTEIVPTAEPTMPGQDTEYEYVWERFPENGSWSSRLNWAYDLMTSFRFVGTFAELGPLPGDSR